MDSLSEDEFLWNDISRDSNSTMNSETPNSPKKRNSKVSNAEIEDKPEIPIKHGSESPIKNKVKKEGRIKSEPESEYDVPMKKKKKKSSHTTEYENETSYDETYLNMKVKEEDSQDKKKSKKHKHDGQHKSLKMESLNKDSNNDHVNVQEESEFEHTKSKKKKKKSKTRNKDEHETLNGHAKSKENYIIHEEVDIPNNKSENYLLFGISTSSDWSTDENNQDEISAIEGENDHILNTILSDNGKYDESTTVDGHSNSNVTISETPLIPQVKGSRQPRLSERIRFEDDDDGATTDTNHVGQNSNLKQSSKVKQFTKQNGNLRLIPPNNNLGEFFSQDDELWILRCPKDIDVNDFNGLSININGRSKIKVGEQSYDSTIEDEQSATVTVMNLLHNRFQIQNLTVDGTVRLRKRIPKPHIFEDNIMTNNQTNFIPLPDTKCRHPLLGSNYKKLIKIPKAIAERLSACANETNVINTPKKRNKDSKHDSDKTLETEYLTEMKPEQEISTKKSKKRKMTSKDSLDSSSPIPKKAKRIKHDPDSSEVWASEKAIEENLFNY